jgi:hypothetical protein
MASFSEADLVASMAHHVTIREETTLELGLVRGDGADLH